MGMLSGTFLDQAVRKVRYGMSLPKISLRPRRRGTAPPPLSAHCALFLDIDGTLLELAATPTAVTVDAHIRSLLPVLHVALGGACALVTGRSITDVDRLFPGLALPVAGQHGAERRDGQGTLHLHAPARATLERLRKLFGEFAARHPGLLLEDKGSTLAVHYRQAPQLADEVHRAVRSALAVTRDGELQLQPGKLLVEIRPDGRDKGAAVRDFMREAPFAGRTPVFVGDDVGDEHGFNIVQRLSGLGIKVGAGRTRALHRLQDVASVRAWLDAFLAEQQRAGTGVH
jgi:trehalose 6-phosphate phosphatase